MPRHLVIVGLGAMILTGCGQQPAIMPTTHVSSAAFTTADFSREATKQFIPGLTDESAIILIVLTPVGQAGQVKLQTLSFIPWADTQYYRDQLKAQQALGLSAEEASKRIVATIRSTASAGARTAIAMQDYLLKASERDPQNR